MPQRSQQPNLHCRVKSLLNLFVLECFRAPISLLTMYPYVRLFRCSLSLFFGAFFFSKIKIRWLLDFLVLCTLEWHSCLNKANLNNSVTFCEIVSKLTSAYAYASWNTCIYCGFAMVPMLLMKIWSCIPSYLSSFFHVLITKLFVDYKAWSCMSSSPSTGDVDY